jgi:hypothetical protein
MPKKSPATDQTQIPGTISAEEITGYLKGALQAARIAHIFVGRLLARVRDNKLYTELGHADLESYCRERLQLGKTSLYNYLRVYDWVAKNHPEWLEPGTTTFIPDLADLVDLIWVEKELEKPDLGTTARTGLETLKDKALTGTLKQKDLPAFRQQFRNTAAEGRKEILSRLRKLRADCANMAGIPHEVVSNLDESIALLKNAMTLPSIGLENDKTAKKRKVA